MNSKIRLLELEKEAIRMKKISWLHLSDLHLGRDIYNEEKSRKKLLEDIEEQIAQNREIVV